MIKPRIVKTEFQIPAFTAVRFRLDKIATPVDPMGMEAYPTIDGVAISETQNGEIAIADIYGGVYKIPGASFKPGHFYAGAGGKLTQDYSIAILTGWAVCVGWATRPTEFVFEPHVPMRLPFKLLKNR